MKTREQAKADYEKAMREIDMRDRVLAAMPDGVQPTMVHTSPLYGRAGSIVFGNTFDRSDDKVTLEHLRQLLQSFPPIPAVHAKGTFTRFLTETFADSDANKEKDRETTVSIFPVILHAKSCAGYSLTAEWFTVINDETWEIKAVLANPYTLAKVNSRRVDFVGGHRYENTTCSVNSAMNPPDGGIWSKVRWGRGSDEWPHDFTLYHSQYDDDPVAWVTRTLEALNDKDNRFQAA